MKSSIGRTIAAVVLAASATAATAAHAQCPTVDEIEVAIAAACPCDAAADGTAWRNHGQYQRCVVQQRNMYRHEGCLEAPDARHIASCAARSTCGKKGDPVLCCFQSEGTCTGDPNAGDAVKEGRCSNARKVACDTDADCSLLKGPKLKRSATLCTDRGGYVSSTSGSVCDGCNPPPPAP